jgi:hypothetical protein
LSECNKGLLAGDFAVSVRRQSVHNHFALSGPKPITSAVASYAKYVLDEEKSVQPVHFIVTIRAGPPRGGTKDSKPL